MKDKADGILCLSCHANIDLGHKQLTFSTHVYISYALFFADNLTVTLMEKALDPDCSRKHEIMNNVVEAASPYLYPCVIEYSLIATGN